MAKDTQPVEVTGSDVTDGTTGVLSFVKDSNGHYVARIVNAAPQAYDSINDVFKVTRSIAHEIIISDSTPVTIAAGGNSSLVVPNPQKYKSLMVAFSAGAAFPNRVDINRYINSNDSASKRLANITAIASGTRQTGDGTSGESLHGDYIQVAFYNEDAIARSIYRWVAGVLA